MMNKTAKEMFEDLGYEYSKNDSFISYDNVLYYNYILFELSEKRIDIGAGYSTITIDELKAINQQCKELGWEYE